MIYQRARRLQILLAHGRRAFNAKHESTETLY
jgi:septum formation topological specificity factor MinE